MPLKIYKVPYILGSHLRISQNKQPVNDIVQLPDIAGPALFLKQLDRFGRETARLAALGILVLEILDQQRDVVAALVQARDGEDNDAEAMV